MIKLLHNICKFGMACWTALCLFMGVCTVFTIPKMVAQHDSSAGAGLTLMLFVLGATWFFPMLFMAIGAYFTRPQAWAEKTLPAPTHPIEG